MAIWGLLANVAVKGFNLWQQKKAADQANDDYNRQIQVSKTLAAEQLAITYNSIAVKSMYVAKEFRQKEFALRTSERQAEGKLEAQAAHTGAMGRRAELARKMAVAGGAEREMTQLESQAKAAQDALINRADMEERATVNRLISNMPDAPVDSTGSAISGFISGAVSDYRDYKVRQKQKKDAITYGKNGPISSTGTNQYGVQAQL